MGKTKIEWCDEVWNPVTGCTKVSEGCRNCYAERIAKRFWGERPFSAVQCHADRLDAPLHWRKPHRVFVNSMSDLFHPDVPDRFIGWVFSRMGMAKNHTFMSLTKRPERMKDFLRGLPALKNVWLGVSVENQQTADERIPLLLETPAAVRFVSIEPMLGPVDIGMSIASCDCCDRWSSRWVKTNRVIRPDIRGFSSAIAFPGIYRAQSNRHGALSVETPGVLLGIKPREFEALPKLDWVICGGESGTGARPMHPDWARSVRDQCQGAQVPFFFKGWGKPAGRLLDGREWNEFPGVM